MQYRKWKSSGDKISALGFGAMRMPMTEGENPEVDRPRAIAMIRQAIDKGVNYLDTAWPYHGGISEGICGEAMADGYRDKVKIATKLPSWEIKKPEDMDYYLGEQLKRLNVDYIDYYLLHSLTGNAWKTYKSVDYKSFLKKAKADGKIKHYGFSFHANIDLFKEIVDDFDWDFVQIQLNLLDENYQAGLEGMKYAHARGMDVVIMEPLRGGTLAAEVPGGKLDEILTNAPVKRTMADWALRYLWNKPEVSLILSGMSTEEQLLENIQSTEGAEPGSMNVEELQTLEKIKEYFQSRIKVNCTQCRYCMPCPVGVNIPECFWAFNHDSIFGDRQKAEYWITGFLNEENKPSKCVSCGECLDKCPQNIQIPDELKKVAQLLEK
jgi:predicted aldo/keto reductase-like oxidoreductase